MQPSIKNALKIIIPLVLGIILVWYSLSQISIQQLLKYFKGADYTWVALGVFCGLLSHMSRAYRWLFMVEPLGYKAKFLNSFMAVFSAYLVNFTIPRAGEVARATILKNYEEVPFDKGFGTILAERIADTIVLLIIILITLFLEYEFISQYLLEKFDLSILILGGVTLFILIGLAFYFIKRSESKIAKKIKDFVSGLIEGVTSIFKMKKKWQFIFHTLFIWGMYVLMFYITSFSIEQLNGISFVTILIGFIFASFSIAATNGGIGSFPEAVVLAFLLFSLPENPSRAFGWIMWSSQTLMILFFGALSFVFLPIYNKNRLKKR